MAKKRGPKSHHYRDLWIALLLRELQSQGGAKKYAVLEAQEHLAREWGINLGKEAVAAAAKRGQKLYEKPNPKNWRRYRDLEWFNQFWFTGKRSPWRPRTIDRDGLHQNGVADVIIHDEFIRLLELGFTFREARRLIQREYPHLKDTLLFNIYNNVRKALRRRASQSVQKSS